MPDRDGIQHYNDLPLQNKEIMKLEISLTAELMQEAQAKASKAQPAASVELTVVKT